MNSDYEKGYKAGYEACTQLYAKRDRRLLLEKHVYENAYFLNRHDFMSHFYATDKEIKDYVDMCTFRKGVKTPRKRLEILNLGCWYMVYETGLAFELNDDDKEINIGDRITSHLIEYYKRMFWRSKI